MNNAIFKYRYYCYQFWGLLLLVVIVFFTRYASEWVNTASIVLGVLTILGNYVLYKKIKLVNFMQLLIAITLIEFTVLRLLFPIYTTLSTTIVLGVFLFFNLLIVHSIRNVLKQKIDRYFIGGRMYLNLAYQNTLYEFFYVSTVLLYTISIYTSILIVINVYFSQHSNYLYNLFNYDICFVLVVLLFWYEVIRIEMIRNNFRKEIWYPIINDRLEVLGSITQKESFRAGNRYLHPHVRVVLVHRKQVYMCYKSRELIFQNQVDIPFTDTCRFGESLEDTIDRIIFSRFPIQKDIAVHFLGKQKYQSTIIRRIMFLYIIDINDKEMIAIKESLPAGRFFSLLQLEENLDCFNDCFSQEFNLLKSYLILND